MIVQICNDDWRSAEIPEGALVSALNRATKSQWQLVCPMIAVERAEPHRSCCIRKESRHELQSKFQELKGCTDDNSGASDTLAPELPIKQHQLQLTVELCHPFD